MWSFTVLTLWATSFFVRRTVQYETQCSVNQSAVVAPYRNIWRPLTVEEVSDIQSIVTQRLQLEQNAASKSVVNTVSLWFSSANSHPARQIPHRMFRDAPDRTIPTHSQPHSIRVINISLLQPNKSDVLPFLNGNSPEPGRYARASLLYKSSDGFFQQEYVVGPLPATNSTPIVPLAFPFNSKQPGRSRLPSLYGIDNPAEWIAALGDQIANVTKQIWNSVSAVPLQ